MAASEPMDMLLDVHSIQSYLNILYVGTLFFDFFCFSPWFLVLCEARCIILGNLYCFSILDIMSLYGLFWCNCDIGAWNGGYLKFRVKIAALYIKTVPFSDNSYWNFEWWPWKLFLFSKNICHVTLWCYICEILLILQKVNKILLFVVSVNLLVLL